MGNICTTVTFPSLSEIVASEDLEFTIEEGDELLVCTDHIHSKKAVFLSECNASNFAVRRRGKGYSIPLTNSFVLNVGTRIQVRQVSIFRSVGSDYIHVYCDVILPGGQNIPMVNFRYIFDSTALEVAWAREAMKPDSQDQFNRWCRSHTLPKIGRLRHPPPPFS
jgi:hypothetical protein